MPVKTGHKCLGTPVVHFPQRHDEVLCPGDFEGALQAVHAFVADDVAETRFASAEYHQFSTREIHLADLVSSEDAVFLSLRGVCP